MKHQQLIFKNIFRKSIFLFLFVMFSIATAVAQSNGNSQAVIPWQVKGNNADTNSFIGTKNVAPLIFKTNGTERLRIVDNGNVGVGTNSPEEKLHVNGNLKVNGDIYSNSLRLGTASNYFPLKQVSLATGGKILVLSEKFIPLPFPTCIPELTGGTVQMKRLNITNSTNNNVFDFRNDGINGFMDFGYAAIGDPELAPSIKLNSACLGNVDVCSGGGNVYLCAVNGGKIGVGTYTPTAKFQVNGNTLVNGNSVISGNLVIGDNTYTPPTDYKLAIKGKIIAEEVNVKLRANWPDYVFNKTYKLMSIDELKVYVEREHHLPEMPTDVETEKSGINISEMITKLLKTQEEQVQYIILLNEQNKKLKEEIELLKK